MTKASTKKSSAKKAVKKPAVKARAKTTRKAKPEIAAPAEAGPAKTPVHQWTNGGDEVLILRFVDQSGKSWRGFQNPTEVGQVLTVPDVWESAWGPQPHDWRSGWVPDSRCGGGIHGWPWGIGLGEGKDPDWAALWQVYGVKASDIVGQLEGGAKCKFRTGTLRYSGDWQGATVFILSGQMAWAFDTSRGAASNSGDRGAASNSGYSGAASNSGYRGAASNSGSRGAASNSGSWGAASNSGYRGAASNSGYSGAASNSGDRGAALSTGEFSSAETSAPGTPGVVSGLSSRARAAEFGCIALSWWNEKEERVEMRCALVGSGEGSLKPNTWYRLNEAGEFVEE